MILTPEQEKAIQAKIDAAFIEKIKKKDPKIQAAVQKRFDKIAKRIISRLQARAPATVDIQMDTVVRSSGKLSITVKDSKGVAKLSIFLNHLEHQSLSLYEDKYPAGVDLIQIFNNGVHIEKRPPWGEWRGQYIHGSTNPTKNYTAYEGFVQQALDDVRPLAESLGITVRYSVAYKKSVKRGYFKDDFGTANHFNMEDAW